MCDEFNSANIFKTLSTVTMFLLHEVTVMFLFKLDNVFKRFYIKFKVSFMTRYKLAGGHI